MRTLEIILFCIGSVTGKPPAPPSDPSTLMCSAWVRGEQTRLKRKYVNTNKASAIDVFTAVLRIQKMFRHYKLRKAFKKAQEELDIPRLVCGPTYATITFGLPRSCTLTDAALWQRLTEANVTKLDQTDLGKLLLGQSAIMRRLDQVCISLSFHCIFTAFP